MNETFLIISIFTIALSIMLIILHIQLPKCGFVAGIMMLTLSFTITFVIIGGILPYWNKTIKYNYDIPIEKCNVGFIARVNDFGTAIIYNEDYSFVSTHSISNVCVEEVWRYSGFGIHDIGYTIVEIPKKKIKR